MLRSARETEVRNWALSDPTCSGSVKLKSFDERPRPSEIAPEQQAFGEDVEWLELHLQVLEQQAGVTRIRLVLDGDVGPERGLILTRKPG